MSEIVSYKCPNCGASIPYDAKSGKLKCGHCGTEYDVSTLNDLMNEENVGEDNVTFSSRQTEKVRIDGKVAYTCPSCGGEVIGDENMSACTCPYCGNSVIDASQFDGILKPEIVVPFSLDKEAAKKAYGDYLKGKWALPNDFKINNIIEKINGMYVPYWLFDADVSGKARFRTTRSHSYRHGDYETTETEYYLVYRDGSASFKKVPVDASSKLDDSLMDALEPYDYSKCSDFNSAYLSGYFADKYDEDESETFSKANVRIKNSMMILLANSVIGYDTKVLESGSISYSDSYAHYALLPVYIFSTRYNGKIYNFAMNGQTGKFAGDLPMDSKKAIWIILIVCLISFVLITALVFFFVYGGSL